MTAYSLTATTAQVTVTPGRTSFKETTLTQAVWNKICFWRGLRRGAQNVLPTENV